MGAARLWYVFRYRKDVRPLDWTRWPVATGGNLRSIALAERVGSKRIGEAILPPPGNQPVDVYGQSLR
jgi:hypothetical protein